MKALPIFVLLCSGLLATSCSKNTEVAPRTTLASDATSGPTVNTVDLHSVYQFTVTDINGQLVNLSRFRGKKILIVNTASQCAYTPQYADLQTLRATYGTRVEVLGFPSNEFGGQEPGTDGQISTFCTNTYNVTFPLFSKVSVLGNTACPLYQFLGDRARNGVTDQKPSWNFCKYLIDETGHVVAFYPSAVTPLNPVLLSAVLSYPMSAAIIR